MYMWPTYPLHGNICLELCLLSPVLQTLKFLRGPSSASHLLPVTGKGGYLGGNRKGRQVQCQFTLPHPRSAFTGGIPTHFIPRPGPFLSFMSHSSFCNAWWMFPSVEFSKQTLFYLTSPLLRLGSLPPGREFILASHHQGAAGRKFALCSQSSESDYLVLHQTSFGRTKQAS